MKPVGTSAGLVNIEDVSGHIFVKICISFILFQTQAGEFWNSRKTVMRSFILLSWSGGGKIVVSVNGVLTKSKMVTKKRNIKRRRESLLQRLNKVTFRTNEAQITAFGV